ncbi:MarR-like DNA-binding transcriptional regulator SgrR of sgrS sRNA [Salirhabdus euzebyi]|uniref:MarR-like DNA-binding transcriptional regulator SgrR of sgrS sRNA n=1 Tax=Salirhabdus euzebyi TaxID=394506 RepID=A0A841QA05_9BACI|nr:ABC transporter substrate-binding protein [Salirhabdus euzebyi]MBB6455258.1 MarR-like DNA-binding transcriptional regulator SgrR of sgrS sRNA [Salirhabdus euzebyi]
MREDLSYFEMRAQFFSKEQNQRVAFKMADLEKIWFCTKKNVKRKLKKYELAGKLSYEPGQGRGVHSVLKFVHPFQEEVEEFIKSSVEREHLEQIVHLLQLPIPKQWITSFSEEVKSLFGFQSPHENKDVLRTLIARNLTTLDPLYSSVTFECHIINQLGDTLVTYNQKEDRIEPHLAHHWREDNDYKIWTFYLRKGIKFHHQKHLTSKDVKYTFDRFNEKYSPHKWLTADVMEVEIMSPFSVRFHLKESNPFFLRYISSVNLVILPCDMIFDEHKWIGTGPFKLKERTDNKLIIEANNDYFLERPLLDEIQFWRVPIESAGKSTFEILTETNPIKPIKKQDIEVGFRFLAFNFNRSSVVDNLLFRKAIYHLLDMEKMWGDLNRKNLVPSTSYFPWKSTTPVKDNDKVEEYLKGSDYKGEILSLYALNYPAAIEEARWFSQVAKEKGINLEIKLFDLEGLFAKSIEEDAHMILLGDVSSIDYQLSFLGAFYNESLLFRRFFNEEQWSLIDKKLKLIKKASTNEDRERIMELVEQFLYEQRMIVFLHHPIRTRLFNPMIKDIEVASFAQINFQKLWVEPEEKDS